MASYKRSRHRRHKQTQFLADRTNGGAYTTVLRLSVCRPVVELRGGPRGLAPWKTGWPLETPRLRGYKGASKRSPWNHSSNSIHDNATYQYHSKHRLCCTKYICVTLLPGIMSMLYVICFTSYAFVIWHSVHFHICIWSGNCKLSAFIELDGLFRKNAKLGAHFGGQIWNFGLESGTASV